MAGGSDVSPEPSPIAPTRRPILARTWTRISVLRHAPEALSPEASRLLVAICLLHIVVSYLGSITTQTMTFVADDFGVGNEIQGRALAVIRADLLVALPLALLADRVGRRRMLMICALGGAIGSALCGLAPGISTFTVAQVGARGFVTATAIVLGILLVEEMPSGSRGWAATWYVVAAVVGTVATVFIPPVVDGHVGRWRWFYGIGVLFVPFVVVIVRRIPESARFALQHPTRGGDRQSHGTARALMRDLADHAPRVAMVIAVAFLIGLINTPARQFANQYLREDRGYNGAAITQFNLITNAPGVIGLVIGGLFSDRVSRRRVFAVGLLGAAIGDVVIFSTSGPALWIASALGALVGASALAGSAIIPTELFPTRLRGAANGIATASGRVGGMLGLWLAGVWSNGRAVGPAIVRLAPAEITIALFVFFFVPETARRALEDLNPEDLLRQDLAPEDVGASNDLASERA